jgi:hypothetical protein
MDLGRLSHCVRSRRVGDQRCHRRATNQWLAKSTTHVATAVSSGQSMQPFQSASSSQNNKIAFHLNISTADPAVPQISGSAARAVEIAM